jgi:hypothetical protein
MCESYSETENWEKMIMERSSCSKRRSRRKELLFILITPCRGGNWSRNRYNGSVNGGVFLSYCDFYFSAIFSISMTVRRQLFFSFLLLLLSSSFMCSFWRGKTLFLNWFWHFLELIALKKSIIYFVSIYILELFLY